MIYPTTRFDAVYFTVIKKDVVLVNFGDMPVQIGGCLFQFN